MNGYFDVTAYASVQAAENACETAGGGIVYFPPGSYSLTTTVTIGGTNPSANVQWRGTGSSSQIVGSVAGFVQPTIVQSVTGVNFITFSDLKFVGNGYASGTTFAAPVIVFNKGSHHRVLNCHFNNNTGVSIQFLGVTDGEVSGCHFYNTGTQDGHIGQNDHTDEVYVDQSCSGIRVHDNHLEQCGLGGLTVFSGNSRCDISHNYANNLWGSGCAFHGHDTRVALNDFSLAKTVPIGAGAGSQGIDAGQPSAYSLIGNMSWMCGGDGIAMNGESGAAVIGNCCWDNNTTSNDCGLQSIGQQSHGNIGTTIIGNCCFDDQTTRTQIIGIHVFTQDGTAGLFTASSLTGNCTYNNTTHGLYESNIDANIATRDDTNAISSNSSWPERAHGTASSAVSSTTYTQVQQESVAPNSMLTRCGIRISAGGSASGTHGTKSFQVGFGSATVLTFVSNSTAGAWNFVAVITNNADSSQSQAAVGEFFYNGTVQVLETTLGVDTTLAQNVTLSVKVGDSRDSVTNNYLTVERC